MLRKSRIYAPGELHHIIAKGIDRRRIFENDGDRDHFLSRRTILFQKQKLSAMFGPDTQPFSYAIKNIYKSCAIITTQASDSVRETHHRMLAILKPEMYEPWLDPLNQDVNDLTNILQTGIETELVSHAVSKSVNSVKNNEPSNMIPLPGF